MREGDTPPQPYRDEFAYLGDMIAEMSAMASRLGSPTLAGILDIAHREAALERERRT